MTEIRYNKPSQQKIEATNQPMENITEEELEKLPNALFYLGRSRATKQKLTIQEIHQNQADYHWLEETHDYIQWIFPNFYSSQFNSSSYALTPLEAAYFRSSQEIGRNILKSFQIYCDFIGVKVDVETMRFEVVSRSRAINALKKNTHNHLRIRRILSSLSVTGFRVVALKFLEILEVVVETIDELKNNERVCAALEKEWKVYSSDRYHLVDKISEEILQQTNPSLGQYIKYSTQRAMIREVSADRKNQQGKPNTPTKIQEDKALSKWSGITEENERGGIDVSNESKSVKHNHYFNRNKDIKNTLSDENKTLKRTLQTEVSLRLNTQEVRKPRTPNEVRNAKSQKYRRDVENIFNSQNGNREQEKQSSHNPPVPPSKAERNSKN